MLNTFALEDISFDIDRLRKKLNYSESVNKEDLLQILAILDNIVRELLLSNG